MPKEKAASKKAAPKAKGEKGEKVSEATTTPLIPEGAECCVRGILARTMPKA